MYIRYCAQRGSPSGYLTPFPTGTHGFLYFVPPPKNVPMASEIRLRITTSHDPASFAEGRDLLLPNHTPWCIPLLNVARIPSSAGLKELLLRDGLTTTPILERCASIRAQGSRISTSRFIHSFGQNFALDFDKSTCSHFHILAPADVLPKIVYDLFVDWRGSHKKTPYAGKALFPS